MGKKLSIFFTFLAASFILLLNGCGGGYGNEGANSVGSVYIGEKILKKFDFNDSKMFAAAKALLPSKTISQVFGYKSIKITYKTKDINGKDINASGLLVIPVAPKGLTGFSVSLICDNHGTIFLNSEAPSVKQAKLNDPSDDNLTVMMTGYAGFAVAMPDYVGYGDSKGAVHPYILKSSAQASLDMIRASIKYMTDHQVLFNGQLFISGYSEGGYVTMALAKDIEEHHASEFHLKGVAPMAGPYDIESLGAYDLNASMKMVYPAFLAEIAYSYSKAYDDINISDLVVKPTVFETVPLFGGDYDTIPIHVALGLADPSKGDYGFYTHYTNELFKDSFINDYQANMNNPVRVAFAKNSVYDWTPKSKINLIQCVDDEIIPYKIETLKTYQAFMANGAQDVNITPIPSSMIAPASTTEPFVHQRCAPVAYGAAVKWFADIRSGVIK